MEKVTCTNCGTENTTNIKYCINCGFSLPEIAPPVMESAPVQPDTFTAKINKQKALFGSLFGIVIFALVIFMVKSFLFNGSIFERVRTNAIDKAMVVVAQKINQGCPLDVDEYTRLESVKALPGKTLKYTYTLNLDKSEIDAEKLKEQMEPQIINSIRDNPQMQILRTYKATFVHLYSDKNGQNILEIAITPAMYAQ